MPARNVGATMVSVVLAIGLGFGSAGSARAFHDQAVGDAAAAPDAVADDASAEQGTDDADSEEEEGADSEDEYSGDFCGGEESVLDQAWSTMYDGDPREAERMVRLGLRNGTIEAWATARAHALLGEIALGDGRTRLATVEYRRALRLDAEEAGLGSRVGLAIALLRSGDAAAAVAQAQQAAAVCSANTYEDVVTCYGAYHLIGLATTDANVMLEAMHAEFVIEVAVAATREAELATLRDRIAPPSPTTSRTGASTALATVEPL